MMSKTPGAGKPREKSPSTNKTSPPHQAELWPDQWISRRKRVHVLEGPGEVQLAARTYFVDIIDDAINLGLTELLVHGKGHQYRLTISVL